MNAKTAAKKGSRPIRHITTCHIDNDISGEAYESLVRLLCEHATTCQLVSHGKPTVQTCRDALLRLAELGDVTAEVSEWHGTRLYRATATLHSFKVSHKALLFLLTHGKSLFSWQWPDLPEDLCFLAADGTPLLFSTAHEEYAQLTIPENMHVSDALKAVLEKS